jgi:hypothetical protein
LQLRVLIDWYRWYSIETRLNKLCKHCEWWLTDMRWKMEHEVLSSVVFFVGFLFSSDQLWRWSSLIITILIINNNAVLARRTSVVRTTDMNIRRWNGLHNIIIIPIMYDYCVRYLSLESDSD